MRDWIMVDNNSDVNWSKTGGKTRRDTIKTLASVGSVGIIGQGIIGYSAANEVNSAATQQSVPQPEQTWTKTVNNRPNNPDSEQAANTTLSYYGSIFNDDRNAWAHTFRLATTARARTKPAGGWVDSLVINRHGFDIGSDDDYVGILGGVTPDYFGVTPASEDSNLDYGEFVEELFKEAISQVNSITDFGITAVNLTDALINTNGDDSGTRSYSFSRNFGGFGGRVSRCSHYCTFVVDYTNPGTGMIPARGIVDVTSTIKFNTDVEDMAWEVRVTDSLEKVESNTTGTKLNTSDDELENSGHIQSTDYYRKSEDMSAPDTVDPRKMSSKEKSAMGIEKLSPKGIEYYKNNSGIANESIEKASKSPGDVFVATSFPIITIEK